MRETQLVDRIRKLAAGNEAQSAIVKGIGDDCAILRPRANEDLVFTSDFVLEDRHFTLDTHTPADVGHKALARSLSDLAAMGSEPIFCLVSLAVAAQAAGKWMNGFYRGLLALAEKHRVVLAGGDLARYEKVVADVICCGRVPRGRAMLRSAANPGDGIYVTGELGGSVEGFESRRGKNWRRHVRPQPRLAAGVALRKLGVKAAMDLSDGLSLDLRRMCEESKVGAEIDAALPLAAGATLEQGLHGGEDYELLFTAPERLRIPKRIDSLAITRIGAITAPKTGVRFGGRVLEAKGFDHFNR